MLDKKLNSPAPGKYDMNKTFGSFGRHSTFGDHPKYKEYMSVKKGLLPGPGAYVSPDLFGDTLPNSLNARAVGQRMSKAKNRFYTPLNRRTDPAPGQYNPKTTI